MSKFRFGLPLEQREKTLNDSTARKAATHHKLLTFQGKQTPYPIIRVSLQLPKYRLENGRTRAAQMEYTAQKKKDPDFFAMTRSENDETQLAQHSILKEMLGNSEKDLLKYFTKNKQDEPIILSSKGFVINGNRRLCALRELFISDPKKFEHFSNIDVIVLPPADPKDIDVLEARLQVIPDIKEDYAWYSLALTFREKALLYSVDEVARLYDKKSTEIEQEISRLQIAEDYLKSRGKENIYTLLKGQEFAFDKLIDARAKLKSQPAKKDFATEVAYILIDDPKGGRNYQQIPNAVEIVQEILEVVTTEIIPEAFKKAKKAISKLDDKDPFGAITDPKGKEQEYLAATKTIRTINSAKRADILDAINTLIAEKRQVEQEKNRKDYVLKMVRDANTKLQQAVSQIHKDSVKDGVPAQLQSIEKSVAELRKWLQK